MEELDRLEALLPRYTGAAPRYTSYPTAPVWSDAFGPDEFQAALERAGAAGGELSLYVHVPFCRSLCHFCACNRLITRRPELPERYLDDLEREIESVSAALGGPRPVSQLHLGGGTPTHLEPEQLVRLVAAIRSGFTFTPAAERSIEADPRVTRDDHVDALAECGFRRISLGVQDFDERVQQAIHRIQPYEQVAGLVKSVRARGFQSVGFDLIYGLPFQTETSFGRTLDRVLELRPERIALYAYAHVTWVAKQQRGFERGDLPEPARKLRIMLLAIRRLLEAGYVYVGMDHFALPEDELVEALSARTLRRNFMGYTTQAGADLVGLGPSAISELSGCYAQSQRELGAWSTALDDGGLATLRGWALSDQDRERRWIIHRLLCLGGVDTADYAAHFGGEFATRYADELEALAEMERDGLVVIAPDGSLTLAPAGRLLVRCVAAVFDSYLPGQRAATRPLFSQTI